MCRNRNWSRRLSLEVQAKVNYKVMSLNMMMMMVVVEEAEEEVVVKWRMLLLGILLHY